MQTSFQFKKAGQLHKATLFSSPGQKAMAEADSPTPHPLSCLPWRAYASWDIASSVSPAEKQAWERMRFYIRRLESPRGPLYISVTPHFWSHRLTARADLLHPAIALPSTWDALESILDPRFERIEHIVFPDGHVLPSNSVAILLVRTPSDADSHGFMGCMGCDSCRITRRLCLFSLNTAEPHPLAKLVATFPMPETPFVFGAVAFVAPDISFVIVTGFDVAEQAHPKYRLSFYRISSTGSQPQITLPTPGLPAQPAVHDGFPPFKICISRGCVYMCYITHRETVLIVRTRVTDAGVERFVQVPHCPELFDFNLEIWTQFVVSEDETVVLVSLDTARLFRPAVSTSIAQPLEEYVALPAWGGSWVMDAKNQPFHYYSPYLWSLCTME